MLQQIDSANNTKEVTDENDPIDEDNSTSSKVNRIHCIIVLKYFIRKPQ